MTVEKLIDRLKEAAEEHGWDCEVVVVDGEGEWPFSIHVEPEVLGQRACMVICLDTTGDPD